MAEYIRIPERYYMIYSCVQKTGSLREFYLRRGHIYMRCSSASDRGLHRAASFRDAAADHKCVLSHDDLRQSAAMRMSGNGV